MSGATASLVALPMRFHPGWTIEVGDDLFQVWSPEADLHGNQWQAAWTDQTDEDGERGDFRRGCSIEVAVESLRFGDDEVLTRVAAAVRAAVAEEVDAS